MLVASSLGLLGFPPHLPGAKEMREKAIKEGDLPSRDDQIQGNLKGIIPATKQLLKNLTYIFNTLAIACGFFAGGISSFIAKVLQVKFAVSSSLSGIVIGASLFPAMIGE